MKRNSKKSLKNLFKKLSKDKKISKMRESLIDKNNGFNTIEVIIIIMVSIFFGVVVGCVLSSTRTVGTKVSKEVTEIISTYDSLLENYYSEVDEKELLNAAISGMIGVLDDPYSVYMDSDSTESFVENVNGSFVGIGISVEWTDKFKIVEVIDNSPAEKAKIKVNDIIVKIDEKDVTNITLDELTDLIRGKQGSKVKLTVKREEKELSFSVKRDIVEIPSVSGKIIEKNIGYIDIDSFSATASEQFKKEFEKLKNKKMKSLIIDVRDNPGGKLNQVNDILDLFFDKKKVLYKIETKEKKINVYAENSKKLSLPVVVLVNHESASASEILASSFQDNYEKATIVGSVTYGKGTIQKAVELSSGSSIKYTTQKWLTPKGKWINEIGVIPDEVVSQSDNYCKNPTIENDSQLQKAIKILKK